MAASLSSSMVFGVSVSFPAALNLKGFRNVSTLLNSKSPFGLNVVSSPYHQFNVASQRYPSR